MWHHCTVGAYRFGAGDAVFFRYELGIVEAFIEDAGAFWAIVKKCTYLARVSSHGTEWVQTDELALWPASCLVPASLVRGEREIP